MKDIGLVYVVVVVVIGGVGVWGIIVLGRYVVGVWLMVVDWWFCVYFCGFGKW